jgi:hypothetical protein
MRLNDATSEGQPEANASRGARAALIDAKESREEAFLIAWRNPYPVVDHGDFDRGGATQGGSPDFNGDRPFRIRALSSVIDEILERTPQKHRVSVHHETRIVHTIVQFAKRPVLLEARNCGPGYRIDLNDLKMKRRLRLVPTSLLQVEASGSKDIFQQVLEF